MNAPQAIAMLDRQIAKHGQTVNFKRGVGEAQGMRGFVRSYKLNELVGLLQQGDRSVVLSPSGFGAFGEPKAQDKVTIAGAPATVQSAERVLLADTLVRVNLVVRG